MQVCGRRVSYATGGRGLPVLFLHGWGLGHDVYHGALRGLVARGCHVIAPSLPGFGGSDDLVRVRRSLAAYATWLDAFLDAVEVDGPVLVLGHSFGGGLAIRFCHDHPDRVRYLVLLNSVGDRTAFAVSGARAASGLRPGAWRQAVATWLPTPQGVFTVQKVCDRFVSNALRNPAALVEVALLAMTADLRSEMEVLARRQLPVLVLWSDRDGLIPVSAFDSFCSAFGTDGHVVTGGHSWLLTNPEVFGEVLDNVIRLQVDDHTHQATTASVRELRDLLRATTVPEDGIGQLLDGMSPLWLLSEAPSVLAGDLALCHPPLAPAEVRAVARPLRDGELRVTVVAADRRGLLADTAATLADEGLTILAASVATWPERDLALHAMTVRADHPLGPEGWDRVGERLRSHADHLAPSVPIAPSGRISVTREGESPGGTVVRVTGSDAPGLLSWICRWFAEEGLSIQAAHVATSGGVVDDLFFVDGECDVASLSTHLQPPPRARRSWFEVPLDALAPCRSRRRRSPRS